MQLSKFGQKFTSNSGILSLMDDLGNALASDQPLIMMGGGNPGHIPEVENLLKDRMQAIVEDPKAFRRLIGIYDPPQGEKDFIDSITKLLRNQLGWPITRNNIALTNGSQSSFFMLFNIFAGEFENGAHRKIQLPLAPEYIGYSDLGLAKHFFTAARPQIDILDDHIFKYRVNFDEINITEETGAICVSRPTNPTGNVITDEEISRLDSLAKDNDIPLIIDGAYGMPFPNLIFTEATPWWNDNCIACLSLSKFGIPAARTGIVVASEEVIKAVSSINAIMNLSTGSFGPMLAQDLVDTGKILTISNQHVKPFYQRKAEQTVELFKHAMGDLPYFIHKPEGAMFLWLWFKDLPISSLELYDRLKDKGVLVVSGHYFFPGIPDEWQHRQECIRVTYSQDENVVKEGVQIIAEEVQKIYEEAE